MGLSEIDGWTWAKKFFNHNVQRFFISVLLEVGIVW